LPFNLRQRSSQRRPASPQTAKDTLLENAIAHTTEDDRIELTARLEDGSVVLAVADQGCGIPAADLRRIFDRFARVDAHRNRQAGGFGLGLATVKAITEAHHGSVRAQSTVGQGSVFEMVLPESTGPPSTIPAGPMAGARQSSTGSKNTATTR
jgi:two-component system phosphate regulon sensor histidine kinase PhoR